MFTCLMGIGVILLFRNCLILQNTLRTLCLWELVILQQMTTSRYSYLSYVTNTTYVFTTVQVASSEFYVAPLYQWNLKWSQLCICKCKSYVGNTILCKMHFSSYFLHEVYLIYRNLWSSSLILQIQILTFLETLIRRY